MKPTGRLALALALSVLATVVPASAADGRKPNILVIVADDLGHGDLGFTGCRDILTPNLDALARSGVRCSNGYVSGPYCSPTRAGLLTGRYQQRFGHEFNPGGEGGAAGFGLPVSETTIADRLRAAGYATGLVGKWHLGDEPKFHPQRRGFDEFFGFLGGAHSYRPGEGEPIYRGTEVVKETEYLTDAFAREAAAFIGRHKDHPFFLELAFNAVHTPMHATDARLAKFRETADPRRQAYAAMLLAMDEAVGRTLGALRASGLEDDTLIVFFSDNGGPTMPGTTVNASRNDPFRGSKRTTLEGGIHVPFVISWKGKLPAGSVYDKPVIQLDVLPTALAAAGVAASPDGKLDGVDLLPYLSGKDPGTPHAALFWRLGPQTAIRKGDWKLARYDAAPDIPGATSKGHGRPDLSPLRLYNLARDPGETDDLAAREPSKAAELLRDYQAWDATLARPLWGPGSRQAKAGAGN
jgi:arylsulfatase A-like enzyme